MANDQLRNFPTGTQLPYSPTLTLLGDDGDKPGDVPAHVFARDDEISPVGKSGEYADLKNPPDLSSIASMQAAINALVARVEALENS